MPRKQTFEWILTVYPRGIDIFQTNDGFVTLGRQKVQVDIFVGYQTSYING
jgi:hypothetical protein